MNPGILKHKSGLTLYVVALIVVVGLMFGLRDCRSSEWNGYDIASSHGDTIDVLIEYTPLSFYMYDDTLGGFDYDLLRLIASDHGLVLKFHPVVSFKRALATIDADRADLLVADIPVTSEYKSRYTFLEPVRIDRQVLVQCRDSVTGEVKVHSPLDLANDTVWVVGGSPVESRIANLAREIGDTIYVRTRPDFSSELLFIMTATGQIDKAVVSEQVARSMADDYKQIDISTSLSLSQFRSWIAGHRHKWLVDSLNSWIVKAKDDESYKTLEQRYIRKE